MRRVTLCLAAVLLTCPLPARAQVKDKKADAAPPVELNQVLLLWPNGAPGAVGSEAADKPSLTVYPAPADKATGAAMVVCPGGGYRNLAKHEGEPVAEWLNTLGVTAFVLQYRLAPRYHHPAPL